MTCPICRKPTLHQYRPFCSRRCADIDLGKWFGGSYAVPSNDPDDADTTTDVADLGPQEPD